MSATFKIRATSKLKTNLYIFFLSTALFYNFTTQVFSGKPLKERVYELKNHKIVLTYVDENKKVEMMEDELLQLLSTFVTGYETLYSLNLPQTINIIIHKEDLSKRAYAFAHKDTIDIYKIFGEKNLTMFDTFMLSHELGHIVMGMSEDKTLDETWATHLEYQLLQYLYKQSGKKFSKGLFNQFLTNAWKDDDYFTLLENFEKTYGHGTIGRILKDISAQYLSSGQAVSMQFIKETFRHHLENDTFALSYDNLQGVYIPELSIRLKEKQESEKTTKILAYPAWPMYNYSLFVQYDILLTINGQSIASVKDFQKKLKHMTKTIMPADEFTLGIERFGTMQALKFQGNDILQFNPKEFFNHKEIKTWNKKEGTFTVVYSKNLPDDYTNEFYNIVEAVFRSRKTMFNLGQKNKTKIYLEGVGDSKFLQLIFLPESIYYGIPKSSIKLLQQNTTNKSTSWSLPHIGIPRILASLDIGYVDYSLLNAWLSTMVSGGIFPELKDKFGYTWLDEEYFGNWERTSDNEEIKKIWREEETIAKQIFQHIDEAHGNKIIGSILSKLNKNTLSRLNPNAFKEIRKAFEETLKDSRITELFDQLEALRLKKLKEYNLNF